MISTKNMFIILLKISNQNQLFKPTIKQHVPTFSKPNMIKEKYELLSIYKLVLSIDSNYLKQPWHLSAPSVFRKCNFNSLEGKKMNIQL